MRAAAALEASTDKHPVTPGAVLPARELLADLLMELGRPGGGARPNTRPRSRPRRTGSTRCSARPSSAEAAGDRARAKAHYAKVKELVGARDAARPELAKLKAKLTMD